MRGGRIVLAEHEAQTLRGVGGHTLARHIAKTDADLAARLASSRITAASTSSSIAEAERVISTTMFANRAAIIAWARSATPGAKQAFRLAAPRGGVGRVLIRGATTSTPGTVVNVVLKKEAYNGKLYYILTSFPEP